MLNSPVSWWKLTFVPIIYSICIKVFIEVYLSKLAFYYIRYKTRNENRFAGFKFARRRFFDESPSNFVLAVPGRCFCCCLLSLPLVVQFFICPRRLVEFVCDYCVNTWRYPCFSSSLVWCLSQDVQYKCMCSSNFVEKKWVWDQMLMFKIGSIKGLIISTKHGNFMKGNDQEPIRSNTTSCPMH